MKRLKYALVAVAVPLTMALVPTAPKPEDVGLSATSDLATGRYDALAGRYLHAEHDDVDDLLARADELRERDLNAIRLQR